MLMNLWELLMIRNQIFEALENLKDEAHRQYKAKLIGIFGSYARGEAKEESDIDILVEFQKGATLLDLVGLGNFLEERLRHKVDVVSHRAVRQELRSHIYSGIVYL